MTENKTYNVYIFKGVMQVKTCGPVLYKMSLLDCFKKVFTTSYLRDMQAFFKCNFSYDIKEKTINDIYNDVEAGIVYIPFSKEVDRDDVIKYLKAGLQVYFMRAREYSTMKSEYKKFL